MKKVLKIIIILLILLTIMLIATKFNTLFTKDTFQKNKVEFIYYFIQEQETILNLDEVCQVEYNKNFEEERECTYDNAEQGKDDRINPISWKFNCVCE